MARQDTVGKHATSITKHGENTYIRYWSTDVVTFDNDSVLLNNGGWYTSTTKTRMNQASRQFNLGFSVYQKDFDWYVVTPAGETHKFSDRGTFGFTRAGEVFIGFADRLGTR